MDNNLPEITIAYESGWNKYTEQFYSKTEWPEAEIIAPLVNDGEISQIDCFLRVGKNTSLIRGRYALQIKSFSSSIENCTIVTSIRAFSLTSTIASTRMRIAANYSTIFSVRSLVSLTISGPLFQPPVDFRFRWTHLTRATRAMALGHHRRVYLPVPSLLYMALKSKIQVGRRTRDARGWQSGSLLEHQLFLIPNRLTHTHTLRFGAPTAC